MKINYSIVIVLFCNFKHILYPLSNTKNRWMEFEIFASISSSIPSSLFPKSQTSQFSNFIQQSTFSFSLSIKLIYLFSLLSISSSFVWPWLITKMFRVSLTTTERREKSSFDWVLMENCLLRQILLPSSLALCWLIPDEAWKQIKDESKWETSVKQNHLKSNKFSFQIPLSLILELYNLTLKQKQSLSHVKIVRWSFIMHRMQYLQCSFFFSSFYTWTLKFNNFFFLRLASLSVYKDMCVIE